MHQGVHALFEVGFVGDRLVGANLDLLESQHVRAFLNKDSLEGLKENRRRLSRKKQALM